MAWQKKVMLCFMNKSNLSYSILMRAGVVRAPSLIHPEMNIMRLDTISIYNDKSPFIEINAGVRWSYLSPETQELGDYLMDELKTMVQEHNR